MGVGGGGPQSRYLGPLSAQRPLIQYSSGLGLFANGLTFSLDQFCEHKFRMGRDSLKIRFSPSTSSYRKGLGLTAGNLGQLHQKWSGMCHWETKWIVSFPSPLPIFPPHASFILTLAFRFYVSDAQITLMLLLFLESFQSAFTYVFQGLRMTPAISPSPQISGTDHAASSVPRPVHTDRSSLF